jgi:ubiquinone biosynthesis protein Coq4
MAEHQNRRHQINYLRTLSGVVGMIRNPEGTESVFDIEDGLRRSGAMDSFEARVAGLPGVRKLMEERYLAQPLDVDMLAALPAGSLGHALARHLIDHGFDPDYYRKVEVTSDLDWILMRMRQSHDIWHVVTGIGTDRVGEIALKAFELAQTWRPMAAVITCGGLLRYLLKDPEQMGAVLGGIGHGYQLGYRAQPLLAQRWEQHWSRPLEEWRRMVGLPEQSEAPAVA